MNILRAMEVKREIDRHFAEIVRVNISMRPEGHKNPSALLGMRKVKGVERWFTVFSSHDSSEVLGAMQYFRWRETQAANQIKSLQESDNKSILGLSV